MITVQKDDIYMEIDERVLSEHERLGWRVVDKVPENDVVQGVSQETHNTVLAENERLKTELARHESSAHLSELALKRQDEQIVQLTERIAELEAELAEAKNTKPDKSKKTTPPPIEETK